MNSKPPAYQESMKAHLKPLSIFLVFILLCFLIFFYYVQRDIEQNTEVIITNNVERQSVHFEDVITLHFEYLEGIASHFAADTELQSAENIRLLQSLTSKSDLERFAIITPDGTSMYDNGEQSSVADRTYFQKAMQGQRALSDPLVSKVDDASRIILAVPVMRDDDVIGVLGASCNVAALSHLLFSDIYDGSGSTLIVNSTGDLISCDADHSTFAIEDDDNLFDFCNDTNIVGVGSSSQFRNDLAERREGIAKLADDGGTWYLAYRPLKFSGWSLCYIVPASAAQASYQFISDYEFVLFGAILIAMLLLLLKIFRSNSKKEQELLVLGQTDALTGLLNKQSSEDLIDEWLTGVACTGIQTFIMLDLDGFKEINDIHGHMAGDTILREFGALLRQEFRESDIIGRIGGDEFCILMKNNPSEHFSAAKTERLCQHVRQHSFTGIPCCNVTISAGVSIAPKHGMTYTELYVSADKALYETKRRGKNGYTIYAAAETKPAP